MKTIPAFLLAASLAVCAATLPGADSATAPTRSPAEIKELAAVEQFLGLSDVELEQMQQVIARIRAMKPAERAALRVEIEKYRQLPEGQRQEIRQGWGGMPREIQDGWRDMMHNATQERRTEIQTKMQAMEYDARAAYRRQLVEEYLKKKAEK